MNKLFVKSDAERYPDLFADMFKARLAAAKEKLAWTVDVFNDFGADYFDHQCNPYYLFTLNGQKLPQASLRILPTTGPTMLGSNLDGVFSEPMDVHSPRIWECTKLCVHYHNLEVRSQSIFVVRRLLQLLFGEAMRSGVEQIIGVYFNYMEEAFKQVGWAPIPFSYGVGEYDNIIAGIWQVDDKSTSGLRRSGGVS